MSSCTIEKRRYMPGVHLDFFSKKKKAVNIGCDPGPTFETREALFAMERTEDELPASDWKWQEVATEENKHSRHRTTEPCVENGIVCVEEHAEKSINYSIVTADTSSQTTKTTADMTGIAVITGLAFGLNQWAFDTALRSIANATGRSLSIVPSVSLLGLSALGMVLFTSALVMLGVFIFLMIQRRRQKKK